MSGIRAKLEAVKASDFPQTPLNGGKVVVVQHDMPVREAMNHLHSFNIYSAPVWNNEEKQYIGIIDMIDIVEFVAANFEQAQTLGEGFEAVFEQAERFNTTRVSDVLGLSQRDPLVPIAQEATLFQIVRLLSDNQIHRVTVFDDRGSLVNIITQSAVLQLLEKHQEFLGDFANRTIEQLNIGVSPVITIDYGKDTIDAFRLLRSSKLYAVPVVKDGRIVTNVSAKDVRVACKDPSRIHLLYSPLSTFIAAVHENEIDISAPSTTCNPSDTLSFVIKKLVVNKVHRVFVLDGNHHPTRVITLTNIMQLLSEEVAAQ